MPHDAKNTPAFREVYRQNVDFVWRVVRRLGVPAADAEDVTQEVFVVVLRKLAGFRGQSTLRTWLYGIAYRTASQYRRRAHVRREQPAVDVDPGSALPSQADELERQRARSMLDDILLELDADKRAVFVFYEIEELPMHDVAEILSCPLQTAYSRLHAAREHVSSRARRISAREAV